VALVCAFAELIQAKMFRDGVNPFEAAEQRTIIAHGATVGKTIKRIQPRMGRKK
jgi:hypothetical protein